MEEYTVENTKEKKQGWRTAIIVILTIADIIYQLVPVDFIPDAVPVAGQIDDSIGVLLNVLVAVGLEAGKFKKKREKRRG